MSRILIGVEFEGETTTFQASEMGKFLQTIKGVKKVTIVDRGYGEKWAKDLISDLQQFLNTRAREFAE